MGKLYLFRSVFWEKKYRGSHLGSFELIISILKGVLFNIYINSLYFIHFK